MNPASRALPLLCLCLFLAAGGYGKAGTFSLSGYLEAELRAFPSASLFPEQRDSTLSPSAALQPEFLYEFENERDQIEFIPFYRFDHDDDERTHGDIRTLSWTHRRSEWDVVVGIDRVFWGVTESRHLVDIINQADIVEDIDEEERLGQPMVNLNWYGGTGTFRFFVLPYFREKTFPDRDARLRGTRWIVTDSPAYESGAGQSHIDAAIRWEHRMDALDIGVSHFHGTSREPTLLDSVRNGEPVYIPFYEQMDQTGIDAQLTKGSWLWKLEGLSRWGQGDQFFAVSGGFEYTFYGILDTRADLGLLGEYHYDGRNEAAPPVLFDRDVFVGLRLTANDADGTELLLGALVDQDTSATFLNLEAGRRFGSRWKGEVEARIFFNTETENPILHTIRHDDYFLIRIKRFF